MISRSLWVMKMMVLPLILQLAKDAEQVIGLRRRQNPRRFIENKDVSPAVERFQDFDALLQPDRQFLDQGVRIDLQRIFLFQPLQLDAGLGNAGIEDLAFLGAEHDILKHGEILDQHEMLVHHADAAGDRRVRILDRHSLAVDDDIAPVGLVEAVEDRHQGRFSGAVFTDNAVNGALANGQVDILIGMDKAKALVDATQLDGNNRSY